MAHHRTAYSSQNDAMEDLLASKVGSLKDIAIKIGDEARYQNKMLNEMVSRKNLGLITSRLVKNFSRGFSIFERLEFSGIF